MRSTIMAGMFRYRMLILGGAVGAPVAWFLVWQQNGRSGSASAWHALPPVALLVMTVWSLLPRRRPETFVVDPGTPAFRTALDPAEVFRDVAGLLFVADYAATQRNGQTGSSVWYVDAVVLGCLCVVLVGLTLLRPWGVQLRPDRIIVTRLFETLIVPWEALAPGYPLPAPAKARLPLTYARAELVRRRGLPRNRPWIGISYIHAGFLAAAIRYYVAYPQHRTAIGTQAEHDRLLHALAGESPFDRQA